MFPVGKNTHHRRSRHTQFVATVKFLVGSKGTSAREEQPILVQTGTRIWVFVEEIGRKTHPSLRNNTAPINKRWVPKSSRHVETSQPRYRHRMLSFTASRRLAQRSPLHCSARSGIPLRTPTTVATWRHIAAASKCGPCMRMPHHEVDGIAG